MLMTEFYSARKNLTFKETLQKLDKEPQKHGLKINKTKTKYMVHKRNNNTKNKNKKLHLLSVQICHYLGSELN